MSTSPNDSQNSEPILINEIEQYLLAQRRTVIRGIDTQSLWTDLLGFLREQTPLADISGQLDAALLAGKVMALYDEITRTLADRKGEQWQRRPVPEEIPNDIIDAVFLKRWLAENPGQLPNP